MATRSRAAPRNRTLEAGATRFPDLPIYWPAPSGAPISDPARSRQVLDSRRVGDRRSEAWPRRGGAGLERGVALHEDVGCAPLGRGLIAAHVSGVDPTGAAPLLRGAHLDDAFNGEVLSFQQNDGGTVVLIGNIRTADERGGGIRRGGDGCHADDANCRRSGRWPDQRWRGGGRRWFQGK